MIFTASAQATELTVLTAGAFKSVAAALIPRFEARTCDKVILRNDTVSAPVHRIDSGESFDVVLMSPSRLEALAKSRKIVPASSVRLAKVGIGVARSVPKPPNPMPLGLSSQPCRDLRLDRCWRRRE